MFDLLRAAIPNISVRGAVRDYRVHDVEPGLVLEPRNAEEVASILKLASENGWRVEAAGANTQHFGNRRTRVDIVISTRAMQDVIEYEPADLVIGVQAGKPLHELQRVVREHSQFLALDPAATAISTIGGVLAAARSGPLRYAHGTPRDHVLGLQVVTGDGRILQLGGRVVKNVAGYDLVRLMTGSAGTLGIITSAYLRLKPLPVADETVVLAANEAQPLLQVAQQITEQHLEAVAMELLGPGALTERWTLLLRLAANREAVEDARARVHSLARGAHAEVRAADGKEWDRLAQLELDAVTRVRLADLPGRIETTLQHAQRLLSRINGTCCLAAHAGDGIVRLYLGESPAEESAFAIGEARATLAKTGGTVIVHSRSGELMRRVDAFGANGAPLELMKRLKSTFDPAAILAPGRFVV